jgi:glycosyltransferase involved in cell wall biosynthesis
MGYQYLSYIVKHNLQSKTVKTPYPKDIINYGVEVDEQLYEQYKNYDSVFFMFARHSWKSIWNDSKGNDKFIRSFARFVKEKSPNVVLLMTKKGIDAAESEALVKKLGIEEYVQLMDDMPKYKLKEYQALPNSVMVDNFWHDRWYDRFPEHKNEVRVGFGFGCMESLASKSLLMTAFKDHEFYDGEAAPILDAFTEEEIYQRLLQLNEMSLEERNQMRQAGYDFVLKWHEQTNAIHKYIEILREVYSEVPK